jgi:integrase/recombinase XerD
MPGVFKRKSDEKRKKDGKWTCWWVGEDGKQKTKVGFTDKKESLDFARAMEIKCRQIREGLVDPSDEIHRKIAAQPIAEILADYRNALNARRNTDKHNAQAIKSIGDVLKAAGIETVAGLLPDRIHSGVAKHREVRSARSANYALGAVKSFVFWLEETDRIKQAPKGTRSLKAYPSKSDIRHKRRALAEGEFERLVEAAENGRDRVRREGYSGGPIIDVLSGPDRAMLYRLAKATGFRANELRSLTPEDFRLEGDHPTITCRANNSKRGKKSGKDDTQPIRLSDAAIFKTFLVGKPPGRPVLFVPIRTAEMVRSDLRAAGIPYRDAEGRVLDFHALRVSYITDLIRSGANLKEAQTLARHSDVKLTLDTYTKLDDGEIRKALERVGRKDAGDPEKGRGADRDASDGAGKTP